MKVLLTNFVLSGRSGTETFTRDLAIHLQMLGHTPIVYTQQIGAIGREIEGRGIPATDDINSVRGQVDIIHGHHTVPAAIAIAKFPKAPTVFVCHDFTAWHDRPPQMPNVLRFVAIGPTSANRLIYGEGVAPEKVVVIANGVDTARFRPGPPLPEKPRRALAFCRSAELAHVISRACAQRGLPVDLVGAGADNLVDQPEALMPQYDLVFASGRTAQEALACGRAVICCDDRGLAGFMSRASFDSWQQNIGLRSLQKKLTTEDMVAEIDKYDVAAANAFLQTRRHLTMLDSAATYVELYEAVIAEWSSRPADEAATFAAIASHMQLYSPHTSPFWRWVKERRSLLEKLTSRFAPPGAILRFGQEGSAWGFVVATNFHHPEERHIWSKATSSSLGFFLPPGISCQIALEFSGIIAEAKDSNRVSFKCNGALVHDIAIKRNPADGSRVTIGRQETVRFQTKAPDDGAFRIDCDIEETAVPPIESRQLGIILTCMTINY